MAWKDWNKTMKKLGKSLCAAGSVACFAMSAAPALADGTTAGSTIQNNVSVSYQVGGVSQTAETASDEFVVDRKVNVTVSELDGAATLVSPGALQQVTGFQVTNLSNDALDLALTVDQQSGGAATFTGTDTFDTSNVTIYLDDGNGVFDAGDTVVTYLDELAADTSATVWVLSDVPLGVATDEVATVVLTADAHQAGTGGSQGAELTTTATNTANVVDTVLADGAGATDSANDGAFSATDDYRVLAAALSVVKTSRVVSDPISGTTNPKSIPGATIEYCIAVSNASGGASATNVTVTDPLPGNVTFVGSSILVDGTVDGGGACQADGVAGGSFDGTNVTGSLSDIAAGNTLTLVFQATID
ncbi:MAG: hypothetical protein R3D89_02140 [Sphingomonadaceae bacterium]